MKGLIRKDLYVLWGACKLQLAMAALLIILSAALGAKGENAFNSMRCLHSLSPCCP